MDIQECFKEYVGGLHKHLFENQPIEMIMKDLNKSHRRRRFMGMYLIQSPEIFETYYEKKTDFNLDGLFNQVISGLLYKAEENRLKQYFVKLLSLNIEMVSGNVSSYKIKEFEKDLYAFAFYETKKELKKEID